MKKYKFLFGVLATACCLSGCYDLDRNPYDQLSDGIFWQNESQVKQGVMGIYAALKDDDAFGLKFAHDDMSDICVGYDSQGLGPVVLGTYTDRHSLVEDKWKSLFDGVMRANLVLQKIPGVTNLSEEQKASFTAEARFLRALFYFELYNFYGTVPLYDETTEQDKEYNNLKNPRSPKEEVLAFILEDLDYAVAGHLPVAWTGADYGRVTQGAAYALRGKVYLYMQQYDKAAKDFEEIMFDPSGKAYNYALYDSYPDLFKPGGDESSEMIFAIQNLGGVGQDYGMPMAFYMGSRSTYGSDWNLVLPSSTFVDSYEYKDGRPFDWEEEIPGFGSIEVKDETFISVLGDNATKVKAYPKNKDKLLAMYPKRDPRMEQTILLPYTKYAGWVNNAPKECEFIIAREGGTPHEDNGFIRLSPARKESYIFRKFVPEGNMDGLLTNRLHTPINFPLIRLADVYLMYAECKNELNDQATAVEYINKVRRRKSTNMPAINSGPAWLQANTKEQVFERIKHERAVELVAEGHRWNDIRRWGIALDILPGDVYAITGVRLVTRVFTEKDMLWPVPGVEIERNPALKPNNPGW